MRIIKRLLTTKGGVFFNDSYTVFFKLFFLIFFICFILFKTILRSLFCQVKKMYKPLFFLRYNCGDYVDNVSKRRLNMSSLHLAIILPFLIAIVIPLIYPFTKRIHTGWFVLLVPSALFAYFVSRTSDTANGGAVMEEMAWVPSLDIHFNAYLDGLGLLFALLITGIGALVVLYSIFFIWIKQRKSSRISMCTC